MSWDNVWGFAGSLKGSYTSHQGQFVWDQAKSVLDKPGVMVEIGSCYGRSTAILVSVGPTVAIDPQYNEEVHQSFVSKMAEHPNKENLTYIRKLDFEAIEDWNQEIKLMHLDHDDIYFNREEWVYELLVRWRPFASRAKLLLHHWEENQGVKSACKRAGVVVDRSYGLIGVGYYLKLYR